MLDICMNARLGSACLFNPVSGLFKEVMTAISSVYYESIQTLMSTPVPLLQSRVLRTHIYIIRDSDQVPDMLEF